MPKEEVLKLWQAIKGDLARARQLLPEAAISAQLPCNSKSSLTTTSWA